MFQAEAVIKKILLPSLQDSKVMYFRILILIFLIYFFWIFEKWVLNFSSIRFRYHERQTNKQTKITTTYNGFLGTCIESKKGICLVYISKGKLSKLAVSPHPAPQHVKETCTAASPYQVNSQEQLTLSLISHIKFQTRNYKYKIKV